MTASKIQRDLLMAGVIAPEEHRHYELEEANRFALAIFRSSDYAKLRSGCDFIEYLTDSSHCVCGPTDAFGVSGVSTAYSYEIDFRVTYINSLVIETYCLNRLNGNGGDHFDVDFCDSLVNLIETECLHGAVVEHSKFAQMSYWVVSIADPRHIQIPPSGILSCNGPFIIHESRFENLKPYMHGRFNRRSSYVANW